MKPTWRRLLAATLVSVLLVSACGGGGDDRSRNIQTIAGTKCAKAGATRTAAKVGYVCSKTSTGKLWLSVNGKLSTKGAKACKVAGNYDAARSRVCATIKRSKVWLRVVPLVVGDNPGVGPTTTTDVFETTTTTPRIVEENAASGASTEVTEALTPAPQPSTAEEFVEAIAPRPIEAQAVPLAPTAIRLEGGSTRIANGEAFANAFTVEILDQNGTVLPGEGVTVVATTSRPDLVLTNAVAKSDTSGVARFGNLQVDGVSGDVELLFTANFGATAKTKIEVTPGTGTSLGIGNAVEIATVNEPFVLAPKIGMYDKDGNLRAEAGPEIVAKYDGKVLAKTEIGRDGFAVFNGLKINQKLSSVEGVEATIEYSVDNESSLTPVRQQLQLVAGTESYFDIVAQPSTKARAGLVLETQPVVRLFDADGNPVAKTGVSITAGIVCGVNQIVCELSGTTTVKTDKAGVARFVDLAISGFVSEEKNQLIFWSDELRYTLLSDSIELGGGVATQIKITRATSVFKQGIATDNAFELAAVDQWGNDVPDFRGAVEVASLGSSVIEIPDGASFVNGRLTLDVTIRGTAGPVSLQFNSGQISSTTYSASLVAGIPSVIESLVDPGVVRAGDELATPLAARFRDSENNVLQVPNLPITLTMVGAVAFEETALTNSLGIAAFSITRFSKAGTVTFRYSDPIENALRPQPQHAFLVVAGAPQKVRLLSTGSVFERSGSPFAVQPSVQLIDSEGNDVAQANVTVTASIALGCSSARMTSNSAVSNSSGRVQFSGLTLIGPECGYRISFRPNNGAGSSLVSVSLGYGVPASMQVTTQPAGAVNRIPLSTQPVVTLRDSAGNISKTKDVGVTAALDGVSVTAKTDDSGSAVFAGVTASGKIGIRTIVFTSENLISIGSNAFVLWPGTATQLVPSESSILIGQAGDIPYLKVKDADGNDTDLSQSVIADVTTSSGSAWISGLRVRTAYSGVVGFLGAKVSSTSSNATLRFTVSGRAISTSVNVRFTRQLDVGDLGPSGGPIIGKLSLDTPPFVDRAAAEAGLSNGGKFIEAAPRGWSGSTSDPVMRWGWKPTTSFSSYPALNGVFTSLGSAATNSRAYLELLGGGSGIYAKSAIETVADTYAFDKDDWLLPTAAEASAMIDLAVKDNSRIALDFDYQGEAKYWTSSYDYSARAVFKGVSSVSNFVDQYDPANIVSQTKLLSVRPIRYFD